MSRARKLRHMNSMQSTTLEVKCVAFAFLLFAVLLLNVFEDQSTDRALAIITIVLCSAIICMPC